MSKFKVGDRVVVIERSRVWGEHCTITSPLHYDVETVDDLSGRHDPGMVYDTDLEINGWTYCFEPDQIRPVNDGDQPAAWSDCAWQPEEVSA